MRDRDPEGFATGAADDRVVFELASKHAMLDAIDVLVAADARHVETYSPYPIPEVDEKLHTPRPKIPWMVGAAGATGCALAYGIIWFCNAHDYPLDVGGRPLNSSVSDIPIMFETTVLLAALTAFALVFLLSGMPRLHDPVMEIDGFERVSIDRFWISVPRPFAGEDVRRKLEELGAVIRVATDPAAEDAR